MAWARHWADLFRHDEWNIGIVEAPIHRFLDPDFRPAVRWLPPPPRNTYRADPFGRMGPQGLEIVCEEWSAETGRGHLARVNAAGASQPLQGFPPQVHLSYPFLLEDEGEVYCVPEMWQAGEVRLFRAQPFPSEWRCEGRLLPGYAGVDSTLFRHQGRWWLAGTDEYRGSCAELRLWHAEQLAGPWTPHARNPVKTDLGGARPGGTPFQHASELYRPTQDCTRTYGGAIVIQRILRLDPEEFAEETVARLEPGPDWPWNQGVHTLSAVGDLTLLDAKRVVCMPPECRRALRRKIGNLLGGGGTA